MAKQAVTGVSKAATIRVRGSRKVREDGRVEMIVDVDGHETVTHHNEASPNEAVYVATVKALRKAHAAGVTDLTIDSTNTLVEGHIEKGWNRKQVRLRPFQDDIEPLIEEFDSVVWS